MKGVLENAKWPKERFILGDNIVQDHLVKLVLFSSQ